MGVSQIILKVGQPKIISAQIFKQKIFMWFFFIISLIYINLLENKRNFSNGLHLEYRVGLSDKFFKGDHPSQIWFNLVQQFQRRRNVIFYQIMPNCTIGINRLKEYMLNYTLPCSCNWNLSSFWFILKQ